MKLCKLSIATILIIAGHTNLLSQNAGQIFNYLENGVKTVHLSRTERLDYTYLNGIIIERQDWPSGLIVERHYYYEHHAKLDSILFFESYNDSLFYLTKHTYNYAGEQLIAVQQGDNLEKEIVKIDSFTYRPNGLIDKVYSWSNKIETILGTERTSTIRLQSTTSYEYDEQQRLIRKSEGEYDWSHTTTYEYNEDGTLDVEIEYLGYTRNGCIQGYQQMFCHITYQENSLGLLRKRVHKYITVRPNGRSRNGARLCFRWRYEYY